MVDKDGIQQIGRRRPVINQADRKVKVAKGICTESVCGTGLKDNRRSCVRFAIEVACEVRRNVPGPVSLPHPATQWADILRPATSDQG